MKKHSCFALVFWLFKHQIKTKNTNCATLQPVQSLHQTPNVHFNPIRNVVLGIYWFLYQPIYMNFTKQLIKNQQLHPSSVAFHAILPLLAIDFYETVILYNLTGIFCDVA